MNLIRMAALAAAATVLAQAPASPGVRRRLDGARETVREDVEAVFRHDPAARSVPEVLLCYPGLHAIWLHRLAHRLYRDGHFLSARVVSHLGRWLTGIEIHPGARIGRRCFIDHGMGVVIGETTEIGDDVIIYQGATFGGVSMERVKRHPTIGDKVVVGAGAKILGPIEVGEGARIGAGSVVRNAVPPGATAVGVPARLAESRPSARELDHANLPDPVARVIEALIHRIEHLEHELAAHNRTGVHAPPDPAADDDTRVIDRFVHGDG